MKFDRGLQIGRCDLLRQVQMGAKRSDGRYVSANDGQAVGESRSAHETRVLFKRPSSLSPLYAYARARRCRALRVA